MKFLKYAFLLLTFGLFVTSCSKEDIEPQNPDVDQNLVQDIINRNDLGVFSSSLSDCDCYGPFENIDWETDDIELINAQIEAALASMTEEELEALFTPVCTDDGQFFPNACFAECEGVTIYGECVDGGFGCDIDDWEVIDCYQIVFPVTVNYANGSTFTITNEDELFELLISNDQQPQFVYPFEIINDAGEVITITSDEEWANLGVLCFGSGGGSGPNGGHDWDCYEIVYPASLILGNNPAVEVNSIEEEFELIINYLENLGMDQIPMIQYEFPLSVRFITIDQVITVNNEDELFGAIMEHCN